MSGDLPDENIGDNSYPYSPWQTDKEMAHLSYNISNRMNQRLRQITALPNFYTSSVARRIARAEPALVAKHVNQPLKAWKNHLSCKAILIGFSK